MPWDRLSFTDTDRTMLLIFSVSKGKIVSKALVPEEAAGQSLPISMMLPPRLVSRCSGELHVGQYWESNSRMNS